MMKTGACIFQQGERAAMWQFSDGRVSTTDQTNENQRLEIERAGAASGDDRNPSARLLQCPGRPC